MLHFLFVFETQVMCKRLILPFFFFFNKTKEEKKEAQGSFGFVYAKGM